MVALSWIEIITTLFAAILIGSIDYMFAMYIDRYPPKNSFIHKIYQTDTRARKFLIRNPWLTVLIVFVILLAFRVFN